MARHRSAWLLAWGTASLLGVCLALILWPPGAVVLIFVFAAATAALVSLAGHDALDSTAPGALRAWLRHTSVRAAAVGSGAVAGVALASVAPLALVVLALLAAATSPSGVRLVRARLDQRQHRGSEARPDKARIWASAATSTARALNDHDLCRAWCTSFEVLQSTSDVDARARIVSLRQAYLDELERRDPQGLRAWLDSGARATGNPDPVSRWPRARAAQDDRGA
jgi:hypothetical protein